MKTIRPFFLCLVLLSCLLHSNAQTQFEVPQNIELNVASDYEKYEKDIIDASKWLEETDLDKEIEKRQQVNTFVVQWISGSPTVTVDITDRLGKIYGKNLQLLGMYLASYSRNFLENKGSATKLPATKAGLISMMNVYKKGIGIKKTKEMEKLIKLSSDNKFDEYVNENFQ